MLTLPIQMQEKIARRFAEAMQLLPAKKQEVEGYLASCDEDNTLCLQFLYGFLPVSDVLSFGPEQLEGYGKAALKARERLPYGATVPEELFLNYVLMPRVNNEYLDLSRELLQEELWQRVQGKSMEDAALEVNYWCYEHATYHPSDDRTLGPEAVMKSTLGRCGEESTFAVSALRSVGIPTRQCYVPRWSHCDDNHAWVELWVDGKWRYLGACEPEPVLNKGWFTAAASRAMVVHSRTLSNLVSEEAAVLSTDRDTLIHSTEVYADCVKLQVQILEHGTPAGGVRVQFQLVNYSECCPIYENETDGDGKVAFRTGRGDLRLQIWSDGKLLTRRVDTRQEDYVILDLADAQTLEEKHGTVEVFDLVPPAERIIQPCPAAQQARHRQRLSACDAARTAYVQSFRGDLPPEAKGNWPELEMFLKDGRFSTEEKTQLLSTLRPKDYLDCTAQMLADTLACAREYRGRLDEDIYRTCILAPRVANEMLLPVRSRIRAQVQEPFADGRAVLNWLRRTVQVVEDAGMPALVPDCANALTHKCINKSAFGVLFVTLCRALGIPARQNPNTLAYEWLEGDAFCSMEDAIPEKALSVRLVNGSGQPLPYGERFTLGRFREDRYETLCYEGLLLQKEQVLELPAGDYVLITTTRQIDGTISTRICYQTLREAATLEVSPPEDQTASRIRQVPLELPGGPVRSCLEETRGRRMVLFLEPGKEPTEHLLQELLTCREGYGRYGLLLFVDAQGDLKNKTLQQVLTALPHAVIRQAEDADGLQALRQAMGVGDERLPFALALEDKGRGLYACANYNIHTAQTLLNVQRLSEGR